MLNPPKISLKNEDFCRQMCIGFVTSSPVLQEWLQDIIQV